MLEIKLADKTLGNGRRLLGKEKSFDSAYALWKFYEDERPGVLERDLKVVSETNPPKKNNKKK